MIRKKMYKQWLMEAEDKVDKLKEEVRELQLKELETRASLEQLKKEKNKADLEFDLEDCKANLSNIRIGSIVVIIDKNLDKIVDILHIKSIEKEDSSIYLNHMYISIDKSKKYKIAKLRGK